MWFSSRLIGLAAVILAVVPVRQAGAMEPEVREIVIHPAGPPRPALKYRLLPPLSEQVPGLAAPLYAQAFLAMQKRKVDEATWEKLQAKWPNMPLEELPRKEIATALAQMAAVLECVDQAARRPRYGSDLTPQNYAQILPTLPTQVMAFRTLMRLLLVRVRHQILELDREGAIRSFQTGYAMARHCEPAHGAQRGGRECAHRDYEPPDDRFDPIAGIAEPVLGHHCAARADG